jgi:dTDP-glucose 4,6-dehydratase
MAELLVTGGAGFIGSNFVRYWRDRHRGDRIVVVDSLTYAGNRANLEGVADIEFVHCDIRDEEVILGLLSSGIDTIVHFAAETHVDRSLQGPDAFIDTNVYGTHSLLKAAKSQWLDSGSGREHRFHHVSTDEVYGALAADDPAFREDTPYAPNSPYSASKAASDHLVRAYSRSFGLQTTTSNCSNNYGPYQFPEKLIPLFLINALSGKPLPIYGDGQQVRDWLHVTDHCRGVESVLEKGRPGETYNIGGGAELPNATVIEALCDAVDRAFAEDPALANRFPLCPASTGRRCAELKVTVPDRPGHDRRYAIDDSRARRELGYRASCSFEEGIAATLGWYLANEAWWQAVFTGSYRDWIDTNYTNRPNGSV